MQPQIRIPRPDDAPELGRFAVACWREAYADLMPEALLAAIDDARRIEGFRKALQAVPGERGMWVAESAGEDGRTAVVGWSSFGPCRDAGAPPRAGELYALYVQRKLWGTGLGVELLERALSDLRARELAPVSLWVLADNARARRFYERHGFALEPGRERVTKRVADTAFDLEHSRYVLPG